MSKAFVALNRLGLGALPGQVRDIEGREREFVLKQIADGPALLAWQTRYTPEQMTAYVAECQRSLPRAGEPSLVLPAEKAKDLFNVSNRHERDALRVRFHQGLVSPTPFLERMVHFWSNHFASPVGSGIWGQELAIRQHLLGKFEDMVVACTARSVSMSRYLSSWQSFGMNSPYGRGRRGMNENLGREILELHTLGVNGGYTQTDVVETSKILTGWTFNGYVPDLPVVTTEPRGASYFEPAMHQPGTKTVLGRTYAEGPMALFELAHNLATSRECAEFVCRKLATHFFSDDPDDALVHHLAEVWYETEGDLETIYQEIVNLVFSRYDSGQLGVKYLNDWDWALAIGRSLPAITNFTEVMFGSNGFAFEREGPWTWDSPAGFSDVKRTISVSEVLPRRGRFTHTARLFSQMPTVQMIAELDTRPVRSEIRNLTRGQTSLANAMNRFFTTAEFFTR